MIKNIIFDMGQVLVEYNPEKFIRQLGYTEENEIKYIKSHIFLGQLWKDMDNGKISALEGHKIIVDTIDDKYKDSAKKLVNNWWKMRGPIDGMLELVKTLYDKKYDLYLLSNASDEHPMYWEKLPYKQYFRGVYVSSLHKKIKPNRDIYEDFINLFKLEKDECIFIDDTKINVDAAIENGIKSHVFVGKDELIYYFKKNNIL